MIRRLALVAVLLTVTNVTFGTVSGTALSQQTKSSDPEVFASTPTPAGAKAAAHGGAKRSRSVRADLSLFPSPNRSSPYHGRVRERLRLTLFDDATYTAVLKHTEEVSPGVVNWVGDIEGVSLGNVVLTVTGRRVMSGTIVMPGSVYSVTWSAKGVYTVSELDPALAADDEHAKYSSDGAAKPDSLAKAADDGSRIDLLAVYTTQAKNGAGGTTQIQNAITNAIAGMNTALTNTSILTQINVVHFQEVTYTETNTCDTDLERLTAKTDGHLDSVHALRDTHKADLVALFTETLGNCGGIAWVSQDSTAEEHKGFSVNRRDQLWNLVLAHELGHNMGGDHDAWTLHNVDNDTFVGAYSDARGWVDPSDPKTWHTVLAYSNSCNATGCTRIPYFSTPDLVHTSDNSPLGDVNTANMKRVLNQTRFNLSNFRVAATVQKPPAPVLVSPNTQVSNPVTYKWNPSANATRYRLYVSKSTDTVALHNTEYTSAQANCAAQCSVQPNLTLAAGNYRFWVLAGNTAGDSAWAGPMNFSVGSSTTKPVAPTLVSPNSGVTNPVTYRWNHVSNATSYEVWVSTQANTTRLNTAQNYTTTQANCAAQCSTQVGLTLNPGTYRFWVIAKNAAGSSPWSAPMNFSVTSTSGPPAKVAQGNPSGPGWTADINYTFTSVSGATSYRVWLNRGTTKIFDQTYAASTLGCATAGTTCQLQLTGHANGDHRWWVESINTAGRVWSDGKDFNVGPPGKPVSIDPKGGPHGADIAYRWNRVANATSYRVWLQSGSTKLLDQTFTASSLGCAAAGTTCQLNVTEHPAGTNFSWWVGSINNALSAGTAVWSDRLDFFTG